MHQMTKCETRPNKGKAYCVISLFFELFGAEFTDSYWFNYDDHGSLLFGLIFSLKAETIYN